MSETQASPGNRTERQDSGRLGLLDYDAVAQLLATTSRHVRKLVEERELASVKVGALVRVEPSAVDDYIARRRRPVV